MKALSGKTKKEISLTLGKVANADDTNTLILPLTCTEKIRGLNGIVLTENDAKRLQQVLDKFLQHCESNNIKKGAKQPKPVTPTLQQAFSQLDPEKFMLNGKEILLEVGMGATAGFGSDRYPYTVWDWHITKGGQLKVWVTADDYKFEKAADWTPANQKGDYVYTSKKPTSREDCEEILVTSKKNRLSLGHRSYYQDPHF